MLHRMDKRVLFLVLRHHRKPLECCVPYANQRNKWTLNLYFNALANGPLTRTPAKAQEDAEKVVKFVTDNRARKRTEMQLALAKILGGDLNGLSPSVPRKNTHSAS